MNVPFNDIDDCEQTPGQSVVQPELPAGVPGTGLQHILRQVEPILRIYNVVIGGFRDQSTRCPTII